MLKTVDVPLKISWAKHNKLLFAAYACSFFFLAGYLSIILFVKSEHLRLSLADILAPIINLSATVGLFYAANRSAGSSRRLAIAWTVLALAQLAYTLGDAIWAILEVGLGQSPFPSVADFFYVLYYPFFLAGVLLLPTNKQTKENWKKITFDLSIIMLSAGLGFWNFLIGPLMASNTQQPLLSQVLSLAYPAGDLLLFWALLILLYRLAKEENLAAILLLISGAFLQIVVDSIYSYQSLQGTYVSGKLLDFGWIVVYSMIGLAGVLQGTRINPVPVAELKKSWLVVLFSKVLETALDYLPYVWASFAFLLLVLNLIFPLPIKTGYLFLGVGGVIALVLFRQVIAFQENDKLTNELSQALGKVNQINDELKIEISERKRAEKQLIHDALHDGLTGLPNRTLFIDRLDRAILSTKRRADFPYSVIFLDLDYFKVINDSLGHLVGDQLLVLVAKRLKDRLRMSDTIARLGGDEFVILLENIRSGKDLASIANSIQEKIHALVTLQGQQISITASIGIIPVMDGYNSPEEVLRDADITMYQAKALGKARFEIFKPDLRKQATTRLELENGLRRALEKGEFLLYYQPILDLKSGDIASFEALLRWNHPEKGLLLPGDFIYVAEELGLILPIGEWVLNEACEQIKQWNLAFSPTHILAVNVNISGKQFVQPDFVDQIERILKKTGLEPTALKLEITETALIENNGLSNDAFSRLRGLGVQLQIDDFGTGYSSLGYLQHFPIHTIKIDKTFVKEMKIDKKGSDLIRAMIRMADELGMETIVEGVETQEQLDALKDLGCKFAQGYYLSFPTSGQEMGKILQNGIRLAQ